MANKSILALIEKQEKWIEIQSQIDELYKLFLTAYFGELKTMKLFKNCLDLQKRHKPWRCEDLQLLWGEGVKTEKDLENAKKSKQKMKNVPCIRLFAKNLPGDSNTSKQRIIEYLNLN